VYADFEHDTDIVGAELVGTPHHREER